MGKYIELTLRACDDGTALILALLHNAIVTNGLGEGADAQVAHEHAVVAGAVETRLIGHDAVTLIVVGIVVVAAFCKRFKVANSLPTQATYYQPTRPTHQTNPTRTA